MTTRREMIGGMAAMGAAFAVPELAMAEAESEFGKERLRFGVLSDIHISTAKQQPAFRQALERLDEWKVDAVLACGDIADYAMELQLQLAADTWFEVFPGNRSRKDGREVVNLLHYGDHDLQDERYIDRPDAVEAWPDRETRLRSVIEKVGPKAAWERCFKCDDWAKIVCKEVKGYKFVLSHFTRGEPDNKWGNNVPGLEEFLAERKFDPAKPFFYSQHRVPRGTACGKDVYGQDDGKTTRLFSGYPNLIAFCGHAHINCVNESNIWQGAFTCVQVPSLRYTVTLGGRENGYAVGEKANAAGEAYCMRPVTGKGGQGYVVSVHDRAVVIRRRLLSQDLPMGPDWVIPIAGERPYDFTARAAKMPPPRFAAGAKVSVGGEKAGKDRLGAKRMMVTVEFPPAASTAKSPRANDYEVAVERRTGEGVAVSRVKRVFSPGYHLPESEDRKPVTCLFAKEQLPKAGEYRFRVTPLNAFDGRGEAICSKWVVS